MAERLPRDGVLRLYQRLSDGICEPGQKWSFKSVPELSAIWFWISAGPLHPVRELI